MTQLPAPRGPLSAHVLEHLAAGPHQIGEVEVEVDDALGGDDFHLALYTCYELHYRGFDEIDERWEWEPSLIGVRRRLEDGFEHALGGLIGAPDQQSPAEPSRMDLALRAIAEAEEEPSLSRYVEREATLEQVREFMIHRSAYQLKEADPHTWAIPRLHGGPKAAMVEVQSDEYGGGRPERIHAQLFADAMAAVGLDPTYGAYLDRLPGTTLATVNLMSMLGLQRRWLGGIVGHLALFEISSPVPNRRYGDGLRRLGFGEAATEFFDEHVVADSVHENIAAVDLAGGLARQAPERAGAILWGARALDLVERRWAMRLLCAWERGQTSLLPPAAIAATPA